MMHSSRRLSPNKVSLYLEPLERRDCPASLPGVLVTDVALESAAVARVIADVSAPMLPPSFNQDVVATKLATGQLFLDVRRITHTPSGRLAGPLQQLQQHLGQGFFAQVRGDTAGAGQGLSAQLSDLRGVFNALASPLTKQQRRYRADITTFLQDTEALVMAAINGNPTAVATAGAADQSAFLAVLHDLVNAL